MVNRTSFPDRTGLRDILAAIGTIYPRVRVQLHTVNPIRKSLRYVPWKERKAVYTTNAVESLNYSLRRIVKDIGY